MPGVIAAAEAPFSQACINIMTQTEQLYPFDRLCYNDPIGNTCQVAVSTSTFYPPVPLTCAQYCASFPGMTCLYAQYANTGTNRCTPYTSPSLPSNPTCNSNLRSGSSLALCTCGFVDNAPQQNFSMFSLFESNLSYCPSYPPNVDTYGTNRRLDDISDISTYHRNYKKIVINVDYDTVRNDGTAVITGVTKSWDLDGWDVSDTYQTDTPEMCTGLESRIRPGDPPAKCSFGHRPYNSSANNCYGKLYSMSFFEASDKCKARGGQLAKVDTADELRALFALFYHDTQLYIGLRDIAGLDLRWDGEENIPVSGSWLNTTVPYRPSNDFSYGDCFYMNFNRQSTSYSAYLTQGSCQSKQTYLCEGIPNPATPSVGGDLLADEGGFCIWYYNSPFLSLPNDQSGNFRNTELAHFLLTMPNQQSNKYLLLYNQLYSASIPGHASNWQNWNSFTRRQMGVDSDLPVLPYASYNYSYHCHFSPTNFGVARVYSQQHMLERLYTGAAHDHCFCGFKHIGKIFDRCDCTRSGETNNNCLTEHTPLLYEETYQENGEYVSCNNCNNASP